MHLVAPQLFQLVGLERLAERLLSDQVSVRELLSPSLVPSHHLACEEAPKTNLIGRGRLFAVFELVGVTRQKICPPLSRIVPNRGQRGLIAVVASRAEQLEGLAG